MTIVEKWDGARPAATLFLAPHEAAELARILAAEDIGPDPDATA